MSQHPGGGLLWGDDETNLNEFLVSGDHSLMSQLNIVVDSIQNRSLNKVVGLASIRILLVTEEFCSIEIITCSTTSIDISRNI